MKLWILALMYLLSACGKNETSDPVMEEEAPIIRAGRTSPHPIVLAKCYHRENSTYNLSYTFKGKHIGTIRMCDGEEPCMALGRYVAYIQEKKSCLMKRGYPEELVMCHEGEIMYQNTSRGKLVVLEVEELGEFHQVYCQSNILKILPEKPSD
jgi:hypothetical protein